MNSIKKAVELVAILRGENGCPWDKAQTLFSMKDDLIEEVYETIEALESKDVKHICEEFGDLLLHVILHSQIALEMSLFSIEDVAKGLCDKLVRRHPHVFGSENIKSKEDVLSRWEEIKREEKKGRAEHFLDKADKGLPPLEKAHKLQAAAAKIGFDWQKREEVAEKVWEELEELKSAIESENLEHIKEELGDVLFVLVNLSRHFGFTASEALSSANSKFKKRFNYIEDALKKTGKSLQEADMPTMEKLWQKAKKQDV